MEGRKMKLNKIILSVVMLAVAVTSVIPVEAQQTEKANGKPVTMTVTANVANDKRVAEICHILQWASWGRVGILMCRGEKAISHKEFPVLRNQQGVFCIK